MALTITAQRTKNLPDRPAGVFSILLDNSYPANGYAVTAANFTLDRAIDMIVFGPAVASTFALIPYFDPTTQKIRVFYPTGGAATAPSTVAAPVGLAGTGASTASAVDATRPTVGLTPGGGKECPTGADLSGYTVYAQVWGN